MVKIAALYHFVEIADVEALKEWLRSIAQKHALQGMLILATEGINGTVAAEERELDLFLEELTSDQRFAEAQVKFSFASEQPFYRMRISIRSEIVTLGVPGFVRKDCEEVTMVEPKDWDSVISRDDVTLIDTRNDYECQLGTFRNAVNPQTSSFREFPHFAASLDKDKPVAMFCTGGIRCEKAASYLAQRGFKQVFNLKGGVLKYLEEIEPADSLWRGECFVFDQRVSVVHGLQRGESGLCRGCLHPLSPQDLRDELFLEGVHCRYCAHVLTAEQKKAAQERQRQMRLAKQRNQRHLGYVHHAKPAQALPSPPAESSSVNT